MKVIIAGSRTITDKHKVYPIFSKILTYLVSQLSSPLNIEIVSGGARGIDTLAESFAELWKISFKKFPANWDKYGKSAGYIRNVEMADYADVLIAVWDGKSKGTSHMIDIAKKKGLEVFIHEVS